jgi:DNA polymerase I-like protein with 3'-5' exonuclease and polymerase domains
MLRICPLFFQTVVPTGRLAYTDPNLQAVTHDVTFEHYLQPDRPISVSNRQSFVTRENYTLLVFDYSQLELRIMAHLSGDEKLIKQFVEDQDPFIQIASTVWNKRPEQVSEQER